MFTVLVFGLSSAHFVFTKVLKVLIKHWRSLAIRIFAFIDDGFGGGNSLEEATRCSNIVQSDLAKSGFGAHPTKSQWIPKREGEHLGFIVNLKDGVFQFQLEDCWFYRKNYRDLHRGGKPTARTLASLVGTIISMGLALGPVARMRTRSIYSVINKASF